MKKFGKPISKNPYLEEKFEKSKTFLIICEGKNTEFDYFSAIPVLTTKIIKYLNRNTIVEEAIKLSRIEEHKNREIWCVFDYDFEINNVSQALKFNFDIEFAKKNNIKVAFSNDCFELWFILHYQDFVKQTSRKEYFKTLNRIWNINYEKKGKKGNFTKNIDSKLQNSPSDEGKAIERAKNLYKKFKNLTFDKQNPCTMVFQLVEELNKYKKS